LGIGDWGLGIGDWANPQSPIPHPQSPIPLDCLIKLINKIFIRKIYKIFLIYYNLLFST